MKKLVLIDGHSFIYRAFYASYNSKPLQTSFGLSTNAIYLFIKMFESLVKKFSPDYLLVALDAGKKTFKHDLFSDYKITRKPMPEALIQQLPYFYKFFKARNVEYHFQEGYEADDIIASAVRKFLNENIQIEIFTSDRDLLQLVNKNVSVLLSKKGISDIEKITCENFFDKYQIQPQQIIDYKCLIGDNSDNLPGVKGIGPKQAIKLLSKYHSIENIIANVENLDPSTQNKFKNVIHNILDIKKMVKTIDDLNLKDLKSYLFENFSNTILLSELYQELEFNSFTN